MSENIEREISLVDICKKLLKRIKLLIIIALVGGVLGGAFGFLTNFNKKYYGSNLEFYLSEKPADTEILNLLNSDSFAEILLLNEYGLPKMDVESDEYKDLLDKRAPLEAANQAIANYKAQLQTLPAVVENEKKEYEEASNAYEEAFNRWSVYASSQSDKINADTLAAYQKDLDDKYNAKTTEGEQYYAKEKELTIAKVNLNNAKAEQQKAKADFDKAANSVLTAWRQDKKVQKKIKLIDESVKYSFKNAKNGVSYSLSVRVSVLNDEAFAKVLVEELKAKLPAYVAENVHVEKETTATGEKIEKDVSVSHLSTFNKVELLNGGQALKQAILYAILLGIAACVIGCVYVVCTDKSKEEQENK